LSSIVSPYLYENIEVVAAGLLLADVMLAKEMAAVTAAAFLAIFGTSNSFPSQSPIGEH